MFDLSEVGKRNGSLLLQMLDLSEVFISITSER
jgi:hypothetical protein